VEQAAVAAETPESNRFGLIADICVLPAHRGQRIAAALLEAMEAHLAAAGVAWLRINVLAGNDAARAAYVRAGYVPYEILHEKRLKPLS
jgi:ribosomal protein S18 acetylase RimI-like enzyme